MKGGCLNLFNDSDFNKGAGILKIALWYFVNALIVRASWNPFMGIKIVLLRAFGAKIGKGICIKNNMIVKSPWNLVVGDDCWIGENVWIDNLDKVTIGSNVCISQGAMLLTGNHDYNVYNMPYRNAPIKIEDGAWIGCAKCSMSGSDSAQECYTDCEEHRNQRYGGKRIYQGNPAVKIRERRIKL